MQNTLKIEYIFKFTFFDQLYKKKKFKKVLQWIKLCSQLAIFIPSIKFNLLNNSTHLDIFLYQAYRAFSNSISNNSKLAISRLRVRILKCEHRKINYLSTEAEF